MGGDGKSGTEGDWRGPQRVGGEPSVLEGTQAQQEIRPLPLSSKG